MIWIHCNLQSFVKEKRGKCWRENERNAATEKRKSKKGGGSEREKGKERKGKNVSYVRS